MFTKWTSSFAIAAALAPALAGAERYNLQTPQTIIAHEIYDLHTLILMICGVIFVAVFGAMIYSIIRHRQTAGHKAAQFHTNVIVEIAWTIVPFLILIGTAYPATKTVISMPGTASRDMTIKATVSHHSALSGNPCPAKPVVHEGTTMTMILSPLV